MLKANYHTHSVYCAHASETLESLVKLAIKNGFEDFGISEHGPIKDIPGKYRIDDKKEIDYLSEMKALKKKYEDKIKLYTGYEADLVNYENGDDNIEYVLNKLKNEDLDYLIMANHTYGHHGHTYVHIPTMKQAKSWVALAKKAWNTGKFKYLVHPDGFGNAYKEQNKEWDEAAYYMAEELTKFAANNNMPLGLNVNGLLEGKGYPSIKFWEIAAKNGASAIIELDAHNPKAFDDKNINKAFDIVKKTGVKLIDKLTI